MDGSFFRGTAVGQDSRFGDKVEKFRRTTKLPDIMKKKVDFTRVKLPLFRPWISKRVKEIIGTEDDVLVHYVYNMIEQGSEDFDPHEMLMNLQAFLEDNVRPFVIELWSLLLDAQENGGVPKQWSQKHAQVVQRGTGNIAPPAPRGPIVIPLVHQNVLPLPSASASALSPSLHRPDTASSSSCRFDILPPRGDVHRSPEFAKMTESTPPKQNGILGEHRDSAPFIPPAQQQYLGGDEEHAKLKEQLRKFREEEDEGTMDGSYHRDSSSHRRYQRRHRRYEEDERDHDRSHRRDRHYDRRHRRDRNDDSYAERNGDKHRSHRRDGTVDVDRRHVDSSDSDGGDRDKSKTDQDRHRHRRHHHHHRPSRADVHHKIERDVSSSSESDYDRRRRHRLDDSDGESDKETQEKSSSSRVHKKPKVDE